MGSQAAARCRPSRSRGLGGSEPNVIDLKVLQLWCLRCWDKPGCSPGPGFSYGRQWEGPVELGQYPLARCTGQAEEAQRGPEKPKVTQHPGA